MEKVASLLNVQKEIDNFSQKKKIIIIKKMNRKTYNETNK